MTRTAPPFLIMLGLVGILVVGCQDPNRGPAVITLLPDTSAAPPRPTVLPPPFVPQTVLPQQVYIPPPAIKRNTLAEPGWIPAAGISNRWTCVVVHHSASDRASPQAMEKAHRDRGWDELGYHFVIGNGIGYPDGKIYVGTRWKKQKHGAHCKVPGNYYNEHGIGICLMGNLDEHRPSARQMDSLARLIAFLQDECRFDDTRILTHGGVTGKTRCPGRYFSMNTLMAKLNGPLYARR